MEQNLKFELLGDKSLHRPANAALISYCPSMDLVALGTSDQQVQIYRSNGHRVYVSTQKNNSLKFEGISWKPNGQLLAIAWSDGSVKLIGAESTKIVHQFTTGDGDGITCIGWASNLTRKVADSVKLQKKPGTWGDLLSDEGVEFDSREVLNLPRDLSQIDIETSLPKLSVLASGGTSEDVFSSRASLDALFRPFDTNDTDAVDVMVVGTRQGNLHLSIYDSFVVGSFKSPVIMGGSPAQLVLHASHQDYSTHSLLLKSPDEEGRLFFVPMDLRFVSASSDYLSLLASRSSALQNLLRYVHEVQKLMASEWKSTQELPSKFLRNINETLMEKDNRDIVQALYHSVATGHTFPDVREWLVDELSERGHKRWDKAVTSGLQNLKQLVHENMLPALDRCSVILSRFSGIAKFRGSTEMIGFSSQQISMIADTIACLHLVSSKILIRVVDELELFASFSAWIRYEIDRLASEGSSVPDDSAAEKESTIDHSRVLLYIQSAMTTSPLATYFGDSSEDDFLQCWKNAEQGLPMFDLIDKQIQRQERGQSYIASLPRVELLCKYLTKQASAVFSQIAEAEKRNVLFGNVLELHPINEGGIVDMVMNRVDSSICQTHIALMPSGQKSSFQIVRVTIAIEKGISTVNSAESSTMQLGNGEIKDIKFFEESMLVLWMQDEKTSLLSIPYQKSSITTELDGFELDYFPHSPNSTSRMTSISNDEVLRQFVKIEIFEDKSFVPEKIQIREPMSGKKRDRGGRIVLLSQDKMHYKIFKQAEEISQVELEDEEKDGDIDMSDDSP